MSKSTPIVSYKHKNLLNTKHFSIEKVKRIAVIFCTNQWDDLSVKRLLYVEASGSKCEPAVVVGGCDACQPSCCLAFNM